MFSIHSQKEKIELLGNFYWCEFHLFSLKRREIRFLTLKIGGRLIHEVDLYTSKYGIWNRLASFLTYWRTMVESVRNTDLWIGKSSCSSRNLCNFAETEAAVNSVPGIVMVFSGATRDFSNTKEQ